MYDPNVKMPGLQPGEEALAGEAMRVFSGRAFADTEAQAMRAALEGLLFELTAKGFSANYDVPVCGRTFDPRLGVCEQPNTKPG